mmetsp:Transcript_6289/g.11957  ORF Transcript_6289/g.11957 Transcript_6289/m.11957 type:complete len:153 (-) Transcript_6289:455-913(-)
MTPAVKTTISPSLLNSPPHHPSGFGSAASRFWSRMSPTATMYATQVPKQKTIIEDSTRAPTCRPNSPTVISSYDLHPHLWLLLIRRCIDRSVLAAASKRRKIDAVRPAKEKAYGRDSAPAPSVAEHRLNTDDEREPGRTVGTGRQRDFDADG